MEYCPASAIAPQLLPHLTLRLSTPQLAITRLAANFRRCKVVAWVIRRIFSVSLRRRIKRLWIDKVLLTHCLHPVRQALTQTSVVRRLVLQRLISAKRKNSKGCYITLLQQLLLNLELSGSYGSNTPHQLETCCREGPSKSCRKPLAACLL